MSCSKCVDLLLVEDTLSCINCSLKFHYGCASMTETNFRKMGSRRDNWKCGECQNKKKDTTFEIPSKNSGNGNKPGNIPPYFAQLSEDIKNCSEGIRNDMKTNMEKMEQKIDEVLEKIDIMQQNYDEMKMNQEKLIEENEQMKNTLSDMKEYYDNKFDALENRARNCNIEIRNVPETPREDVVAIVKEIGKVIGIADIKEGDIQVAHRVATRNKERGARPIVAHLSSRYNRNKWIQYSRTFKKENSGQLTAKNINSTFPDTTIHINEHLTVQMKMLLKEAKEFAKTNNNVKYVWIKDAFILMKKDDNDRNVKKINCRKELDDYKKNFSSQVGNY